MGTAIAAGRGGIVRRSVLWLSVLASVGGCASIPSSLRNLHRGCSQGNSASCVSLGSALYEGKDPSGGHVDLDYAKARQAFTAGCKRDDAASCQRLGTMLDKGEGGERDKVLAVELWRHSCELGDGVSCSKTAESYMTGSVGIKNNDIAFAYAKTGCEQRDERSCVLWKKLGGTPRVLVAPVGSELASLISACEQQNDSRACFTVGERFDKGDGAEQNKEKAAASYRFACQKGDMRGCHNLGVMMINAEGIPADRPGGLLLLNKSCDSGQRASCDQMVRLLTVLCGRSDGDACTILGRLYIKGDKGLETNVTKGLEYLRRGCSAGDKDGCEDVKRLGL